MDDSSFLLGVSVTVSVSVSVRVRVRVREAAVVEDRAHLVLHVAREGVEAVEHDEGERTQHLVGVRARVRVRVRVRGRGRLRLRVRRARSSPEG